MAKTPGYNIRLKIRFSVNSKGREIAHYWSKDAMRYIPLPLEKAKLLIATENADRINSPA